MAGSAGLVKPGRIIDDTLSLESLFPVQNKVATKGILDSQKQVFNSLDVSDLGVFDLISESNNNHIGYVIRYTGSGDGNILIPDDFNIPNNSFITFIQTNVGKITLLPDTNVNFIGDNTTFKIGSYLTMIKRNTNDYDIIGGTVNIIVYSDETLSGDGTVAEPLSTITPYNLLTNSTNTVTWDTAGGLNKSLSTDNNFTLNITNLKNGMKGSLVITPTAAIDILDVTATFAGTGTPTTVRYNGDVNLTTANAYNLTFQCDDTYIIIRVTNHIELT